MSVVGVVLLAGSLNLETIIGSQAAGGILAWNFWTQPLAAMIFLAAAMAETNRLPFDLPECEQELVGGYHTEYDGMKFAFFFLSEYTHIITVSYLLAILFFGGWHFPLIAEPGSNYYGADLVKFLVLFGKALTVIVFFMLIRWTIPRFKFDQLMALAWHVLIPLSLLNLFFVMVFRHVGWHDGWERFLLLPISIALFVGAGLVSAWHAQKAINKPTVKTVSRAAAAAGGA
ncbi:MAG: complex I subunit 1/NuoH family protein, partial [Planctomycetia bacterium]